MMTTWIDQHDGVRWTGIARIATIGGEVVVEHTDDFARWRLMRDFDGATSRMLERELEKVQTWAGAMFAAIATVQRDLDDKNPDFHGTPVYPDRAN